MEAFLAILVFAFLFALFAVSRAGEDSRPCAGRSDSAAERCRACPLRDGGSAAFGACPGSPGRSDDDA